MKNMKNKSIDIKYNLEVNRQINSMANTQLISLFKK